MYETHAPSDIRNNRPMQLSHTVQLIVIVTNPHQTLLPLGEIYVAQLHPECCFWPNYYVTVSFTDRELVLICCDYDDNDDDI